MSAAPPPRTRVAACAGGLGLVLLLAGPALRLAFRDPPDAVRAAPPFLLAGAAAAWAAALVLASPRARRRGLLAAAACVAALVFAEVVLRLAFGAFHAPLYRVHPVWLYEHVPGTRRINVRREDRHTEQTPCAINAEGLRGPELLAPGAARRVIVYGDSMVAALATPWEETFVARLEGELAATGANGPVEALDAGVSGYGPDQACLRMDAELPRLRADLAVVVVTVENDYGDLVRNRLFDLTPDGALARNEPRLAEFLRDEIEASHRATMLATTAGEAMKALHALFHGRPEAPPMDPATVLQICAEEVQDARAGGDEVTNLYWDHADEDVRLDPQGASARHKTLLMKRVLGEIRDTAKRHGTALLLVLVPSPTDVVPAYGRGAVDAARFPAYRPDNLAAPVAAMAQQLGVACADLTQAYRDAGAASLYFPSPDTHWNSAGQALAARVAAREIAARGLLR